MFVLKATPERLTAHWELTVNRADARALAIYERHYSCYQYADGRDRNQYVAPGEYVSLMTAKLDALFVWSKQRYRADRQTGINCAVFRNESRVLSSLLIREAMDVAQAVWPGQRLFTFIDPHAIRSTNPGYCFLMAGWTRCGWSKAGLLIMEYPTHD